MRTRIISHNALIIERAYVAYDEHLEARLSRNSYRYSAADHMRAQVAEHIGELDAAEKELVEQIIHQLNA